VRLVDEHTGDAWKLGQRPEERALVAVEHVDAVGARVGNIHPTAGAVGIGVIETELRAPGGIGTKPMRVSTLWAG
jgi:hypothetical protein